MISINDKKYIYTLVNDQQGGKVMTNMYHDLYKNNSNYSIDYSLNKGSLVYGTYGEIEEEGLQNLIKYLNIDKNDIFYDLGSGLGKVVLYFYIETSVKTSIGIEFYKKRSMEAEQVLKKLYKKKPQLLDDNRIITFQNSNIKDVNLDDATIIFMCSECYSPELLDTIYDKIKNNKNLKYLISIKKYDKFKELLPKETLIPTPCTWSKNKQTSVYSSI